MRTDAFHIQGGLFKPEPPFCYHHALLQPGVWFVRDAHGVTAATAKTRAGARAAMLQLYALRRAS